MAEQLRIPASSGGLVRYFDEYKSKLQVKPEFIILAIILVIVFSIVIRFLIKL